MTTTYTTTKGNKVSIDYQDFYYNWKDVREYVRWDSNECKVYMDLGWDYIKIDETWLESHEISYLLWDTEFMDDFDMDEQMEWNRHMKDLEEDHLITYFRVRDWWSNWLDLHVVMDPSDANWFIIRKKKEDEEYPVDDMKETLNYFRAYVEWSFVQVSLYSPTTFISEKDPKVKYIHYDYGDWRYYCLSEENALDSVDTKYWWEIIKDSKREGFSSREYKGPGDN